jgi:hypothetical protein
MPIKDAEDQFMKILNSCGAKLVKDASHLDAIIGMGIFPIVSSNEQAVILLTQLPQMRRVVMTVAQDKTHFSRNFCEQMRSGFTISDIGGCECCGEREPYACHDRDNMPFPAIHESMPARFGEVGLRYQSKCEEALPSRDAFDARRHRGHAG